MVRHVGHHDVPIGVLPRNKLNEPGRADRESLLEALLFSYVVLGIICWCSFSILQGSIHRFATSNPLSRVTTVNMFQASHAKTKASPWVKCGNQTTFAGGPAPYS